MNQSLIKNVLFNLAVGALVVAAFSAAPVSGETLFSFVAVGGIGGIAFSDYRTRRPLQLKLKARVAAPVALRHAAIRQSALIAA